MLFEVYSHLRGFLDDLTSFQSFKNKYKESDNMLVDIIISVSNDSSLIEYESQSNIQLEIFDEDFNLNIIREMIRVIHDFDDRCESDSCDIAVSLNTFDQRHRQYLQIFDTSAEEDYQILEAYQRSL